MLDDPRVITTFGLALTLFGLAFIASPFVTTRANAHQPGALADHTVAERERLSNNVRSGMLLIVLGFLAQAAATWGFFGIGAGGH